MINKKENAFSLAEMMVVMLIVAVFVAAMMPIMTKRKKASIETPPTTSIPHGKVMCTSNGCSGSNITGSAPGPYTFTVPDGVKTIWVSASGGGGGGSYAPKPPCTVGGGAGAAVMSQQIPLTTGVKTLSISIGKAGLSGMYAVATNGGMTSITGYINCNGGVKANPIGYCSGGASGGFCSVDDSKSPLNSPGNATEGGGTIWGRGANTSTNAMGYGAGGYSSSMTATGGFVQIEW